MEYWMPEMLELLWLGLQKSLPIALTILSVIIVVLLFAKLNLFLFPRRLCAET